MVINNINTLLCPSKSNSKQMELTVHTSCYWGLKLILCLYCQINAPGEQNEVYNQSSSTGYCDQDNLVLILETYPQVYASYI